MLIKGNWPLKICIATDMLIHINKWNAMNREKGKRKRDHSLKYFFIKET